MVQLHILHLYPNELNTYGDHGNALTLTKRIRLFGMEPVVHHHHPGAKLPNQTDIVLGGGGQDSAQADVQNDILKIGRELHSISGNGVPMVLICGTYQLFCHRFLTANGDEVKGIGIFDAETVGGNKRLIGNVKVKSEFGILYGFENHSGQTFLKNKQQPLGIVIRGAGNNGKDKTEGARTNNTFGTYLHGPLLPNNPQFADAVIRIAAENNNFQLKTPEIDDNLAELVRVSARGRRY